MLTVSFSAEGVRPLQKEMSSVWHYTASEVEVPALGSLEYSFIAITPRSTLTQSGSTCWGFIYGSNSSVWKLFVLDRNTWYLQKKTNKQTLKKLYKELKYKCKMYAIP